MRSLRLVPPSGQGTDPPKRGRRRFPDLTTAERRALRQALRNLRLRYGGWDVLAAVMDVPEASLKQAANPRRGRGSAGLALRAARAAGVPVEALLSGTIRAADCCPTCGQRKAGAA